MAAKAKVSVTVERELLREVDRIAGKQARSAVFEEALAGWIRRRRKAELDLAIEQYYRSMHGGERDENANWATLADRTVRERWDES